MFVEQAGSINNVAVEEGDIERYEKDGDGSSSFPLGVSQRAGRELRSTQSPRFSFETCILKCWSFLPVSQAFHGVGQQT